MTRWLIGGPPVASAMWPADATTAALEAKYWNLSNTLSCSAISNELRLTLGLQPVPIG